MIVVLGRADDPPLSMLIDALQEAGQHYHFVELRALDRDHLRLQTGASGLGGQLQVAGQRIDLADIHSVYTRPLALGSQWPDPAAAGRAQRAMALFLDWLDVAPARVANRPRAMNSNNAKPMQAQWIGEAGFLVPETLVTSSADEAQAFWQAHGRVIYKSISGVRSIVRELDAGSADRLALLRDLPAQFQAHVPGVDLRVHVVGERCFAAEIRSTATDYRYARGAEETALAAVELPDTVAAQCVALAQSLELPLAGIDLRRRPDGAHVCFEVNPMPAYSYYESNTGLPISQALAAWLARPD